jgi:tetratricopeptide (TPR) repeat protein
MSESATSAGNVGAILDAYLKALEQGRAPTREELLAQHPQCAAELAAALDGLEFIHRATREMPRSSTEGGELAERQLLGDFRLVREVGRGGMAVVYEAEQVSLGRRVALKVLPFAAVLDPKQLQRFKNEALAAAHLHHPHIVPVFAVGCERGVHYYAMQLVEGQSLAAVIREMKTRAPAAEPKTPATSHGSNRDPGYVRMAVALGMQAAEALDHAHQLGVVHRDVKPGNLLVDALGELWITDFGLARTLRDGDLTVTGELLGTYRYMSPEQTLAKRAPMDHRTDVYSLGVTLYELLTLEHAFPGDDPHAVMRDIAEKEPVAPRKFNDALPVDLETIVLKAMSKDPSSRYSTALEMAEDLGRYLEDQPILARRPSVTARASKWVRRHKGFVTAAFVVLLVGLVGLTVDLFRVGNEQRQTKAALDRANDNLQLANDNLLLARSAVDKFLVEIGISGMADLAPPRPARRRLLEAALRFHVRNFSDAESIGTRVTILHALQRYDDAIELLDGRIARDASDAWSHMQRGHMLWHEKKYDDALAALEVACTTKPDLAEAHSFKGCVLKDVGRLPDALAAHDRALELDGKSAVFHNYRANVLADMGKLPDALAGYETACALDPNLPNCLCGKGDVLAGMGRLEEALAAYERATAVDPSYAWAWTARGMVLVSLGRIGEAVRSHDRGVELDPGSARAHVNRGLALREAGRLDDAIAAYRKAIDLEATLVQAHDNLAIALALQGKHEEALAEANEGIRLGPKDARARFNLGCVYAAMKEWENAIREYQRAIELEPGFQRAYINLAAAFASSGKLDEAIKTSNAALEFGRDDADLWGGLGNALRDQGAYEGALKAYGEVVRIKPNYVIGRHCLGQMLAKCRKYREAIASFEQALKIDPKFANSHYEIGMSYLALGDPDHAIEAFDNAVKVRPEFADALRMKARAYAAKGDRAREIEAYEAAVQARADFVEAWIELGRANNDARRTDAAITALTKALDLNPDMPEAHLNLGIAFCDKDEPDRAIVEFHTVIELLQGKVPAVAEQRNDRQRHDASVLALAYNSLGSALKDKKERAAELAAYHDAIRIDPRCASAHCNLALALYGDGKNDAECEAHYKAAIDADRGMAEAHYGLGQLYQMQGRYRDALPYLQKGHELGSKQPGWRAKSAERIATVEKQIAFEDRLEDVVKGTAEPGDEGERLEYALILYGKKRFLESALFFEKALANDASLADDLARSNRYNAACTAVLAAANGADDPAVWRGRALQWLRVDLAARQAAGKVDSLAHWKEDPDFKSVRDEVAALPAGEREAWKELWSDLDKAIAPQ